MVTVRGPGNGTAGYCFLTATTSNFTTAGPWPSTLPGQLQGTLTAIPPGTTPEQAQALLEPGRRTVRIRITPAPNPQVTIDLDFHAGQGFQRVLAFAAPQPEPASYRFGFAASTGLFTDVHLIRNVTVSTLTPLRPNADPRRRHPRTVTVQRNRSTVDLHVHSRHRGLGVNRQDHRDRSRHHRRWTTKRARTDARRRRGPTRWVSRLRRRARSVVC
jgi:hypothetical protein